MTKIPSNPIRYEYGISRNQALANAINTHWKCYVAKPGNTHYVESHLVNGVPKQISSREYNHPDIVWVYKDDEGKWIVRR